MRKMKIILMTIVLGILFISCDDEVKTVPKVNADDLAEAYTATDTLQFIVVETDEDITYYRLSQDKLYPDHKIVKDSPTKLLISFMVFFVCLWFFGLIYIIRD